tara:strand:+ start:819 stop:1088 length:270 start_codon:yes stop_codon:yes gene_type:complete
MVLYMTRGVYGSAGFGLTVKDDPQAYHRAYYQKHKAKIAARNLKKYHDKPEKHKAQRREEYWKKVKYVQNLEKENCELREKLLKNNIPI